jgi:Fe-S-cluster containining protein
MNICSEKCFGYEGYDGSCCTIQTRDYIIGPHRDAADFLQRLAMRLGREVQADEVFMGFEEGRDLFPDRSNWQSPESYPALRVEMHSPRRQCIFYNLTLKQCTVYDIRPQICRDYFCAYFRSVAPGG